jgi:hypothetical protein
MNQTPNLSIPLPSTAGFLEADVLTLIAAHNLIDQLLSARQVVSDKGEAGGYAPLDQNKLIPAAFLPSFVDDVLEYATVANFPASGETGKIYIAINAGTAANPSIAYRWGGSAYHAIDKSPGTTDALPEGNANLYFSNSRARAAISVGGSLVYDPLTGVVTYNTHYKLPVLLRDGATTTNILITDHSLSITTHAGTVVNVPLLPY